MPRSYQTVIPGSYQTVIPVVPIDPSCAHARFLFCTLWSRYCGLSPMTAPLGETAGAGFGDTSALGLEA
jgi:hypothetical protein